MAEKTIIRAIATGNNVSAQTVVVEFKKSGDLGETAMALKIKKQKSKSKDTNQISKISVSDVYQSLLEIANQTGEGSQERKVAKTADLLRELDPLGAKYAVRIILGNLRLGFSDKTVLDALSVMMAGNKSAREKLEAAYNVRPDVGWLAKRGQGSCLPTGKAELRVQSLSDIKPQLGVPIMPALCQRLPAAEEIIEKMKQVAVEPKWDGQRIQAHVWIQRPKAEGRRLKENQEKKAIIKLFTRSLEDVTSMFPDLVDSLENFIGLPSSFVLRPSSFILDGEAVAIDPKTGRVLPFQMMITRKRKYGIQEKLLDVPVKYMVFDIPYLNGKSLMNEEFTKRRQILERSLLGVRQGDSSSHDVIQLAPQLVTSSPAVIRKFLKQQIDNGLEGIVVKRSDAAYIPGRTQFSWVKLKWEGEAKTGGLLDTVDCVVMGTYAGKGKRVGFGVGAFLVGILSSLSDLNNLTDLKYLTISKIGTGLTDEQWRELRVKSKEQKAKSKPKEYDVPKELTPDIWLKPELVAEIQADNITNSPLHTAGYALRFPRLVRYRSDKRPEQATTIEEIEKLYEMQK